MATVQIFEVISNKFNTVSLLQKGLLRKCIIITVVVTLLITATGSYRTKRPMQLRTLSDLLWSTSEF
jgi:hypothetical protein